MPVRGSGLLGKGKTVPTYTYVYQRRVRGPDLFSSRFVFCLQIMYRAEYFSKNNRNLAHGVDKHTVQRGQQEVHPLHGGEALMIMKMEESGWKGSEWPQAALNLHIPEFYRVYRDIYLYLIYMESQFLQISFYKSSPF